MLKSGLRALLGVIFDRRAVSALECGVAAAVFAIVAFTGLITFSGGGIAYAPGQPSVTAHAAEHPPQ